LDAHGGGGEVGLELLEGVEELVDRGGELVLGLVPAEGRVETLSSARNYI
jgi:hypothetical protein